MTEATDTVDRMARKKMSRGFRYAAIKKETQAEARLHRVRPGAGFVEVQCRAKQRATKERVQFMKERPNYRQYHVMPLNFIPEVARHAVKYAYVRARGQVHRQAKGCPMGAQMSTGLANASAVRRDPQLRDREGYRFGGRYVDDCGHVHLTTCDISDAVNESTYGNSCKLVIEKRQEEYLFLGLEVVPAASCILVTPASTHWRNIISGAGMMSEGKLIGVATGLFCRAFDQTDNISWSCRAHSLRRGWQDF